MLSNRISCLKLKMCLGSELDGDGFLVTVYQTTKEHKKGERLWPR